MKLIPCCLWCFLLVLLPSLAPAQSAPRQGKPGYRVVVEVLVNAEGKPIGERIAQSDDTSGEQLLNRVALSLSGKMDYLAHAKGAEGATYKVLAPFDFPVPEDEGPQSEGGPRPSLLQAPQPVYPVQLAASGQVGGAILEIVTAVDGKLKSIRLLRASHPEFGQAALAAVRRWTFLPGKANDQPVEVRCRVAICFATTEKEPDYLWRIAPRPSLGAYSVIHPVAKP